MNTTKAPFLTDVWYNRFKWAVQILLPSIATFYFTLGNVWGFGYVEQVVGTLAALATFVGVVVGVNARRYQPYAGEVVVEENEDGAPYLWLNLEHTPEDFVDRDELLMRVKR